MTDNFDAKSVLFKALQSDEYLATEVIGGFHNRVVNDSDDEPIPFPRVVYQEIRNDDTDYRDNEPTSAIVGFQISIFTDSETVSKETPIAKAVDKLIKSIGYKRYDLQDLYETDTKRYHKAMRYHKKLF